MESSLIIEKLRVASEVRQSHLKLNGRTDKETNDPVKQEFMRLGISSMNTMKDLKKIGDVKLTPEQHDRYVVLMGAPLKVALDKLVASPRYERLSETLALDVPGGKALAIQGEINKYKQKARVQLYKEFPEIKEALKYNQKLGKEGKKANSNWLMEQLSQ